MSAEVLDQADTTDLYSQPITTASIGTAKRIQLCLEGWPAPANAVVVARPTRWGNPVVVGSQAALSGVDAEGLQYSYEITVTPRIAVDAFRNLMRTRLTVLDPDDPEDAAYVQSWRDALAALRGHDLACWCPLHDQHGNPVPCHADVLLALANPAPRPVAATSSTSSGSVPDPTAPFTTGR
jgi:hypothetical protein